MTDCLHKDLHYHINNAGFGDTNLHYLEIGGFCNECRKKISFIGAEIGVNPKSPAMSIDGSEIRLPFLMEGETIIGEPRGFKVSIRGE